MTEPNLQYLEQEWLKSKPAEVALGNLLSGDACDSYYLPYGFRRTELDHLVLFHAVVEVALMTGFVREVSNEFGSVHLPLTKTLPLERYSRPFELSQLFRRRLEEGKGVVVDGGSEAEAAFFQLLDLLKTLAFDADIEAFACALNPRWRRTEGGGCGVAELRLTLTDRERAMAARVLDAKARSECDRAVSGFWKFIGVCEAYVGIVGYLKKKPVLARAMALVCIHTFCRFEQSVMLQVTAMIHCVSRWIVDDADRAHFLKRLKQMEEAVKTLSTMAGMSRPKAVVKRVLREPTYGNGIVADPRLPLRRLVWRSFEFELNEPGEIHVSRDAIVLVGHKYSRNITPRSGRHSQSPFGRRLKLLVRGAFKFKVSKAGLVRVTPDGIWLTPREPVSSPFRVKA